MKTQKIIAILSILALTGCAATGENLKGNVYKAGQVNTTQAARGIKILKLMSAQVEVDNSKQKQQAQVAGGVLGALAGGLAGGFGGIGAGGTVATTAGGGAIGVAAGSLVSDKVLVEGVTIAYSENAQMFTSTQVGKLCEYKLGDAVVVSTTQNETRIQANATCPVVN
jgi:outer membrane lipoprotein SlyB